MMQRDFHAGVDVKSQANDARYLWLTDYFGYLPVSLGGAPLRRCRSL